MLFFIIMLMSQLR